MLCRICKKEITKIVPCTLVPDICKPCCFKISAGETKIIQILRQEFHFTKEEILRRCSSCILV